MDLKKIYTCTCLYRPILFYQVKKKTFLVVDTRLPPLSVFSLSAVPAPTTTPAEPSHVGEITIEDISDHADTSTMEETEPISAVEPENDHRVRGLDHRARVRGVDHRTRVRG